MELESELESVKFCQFQLWPKVAGYHSSTDNDFIFQLMSGGVEIKLKHHLVIRFCLIKGIRDNFGARLEKNPCYH